LFSLQSGIVGFATGGYQSWQGDNAPSSGLDIQCFSGRERAKIYIMTGLRRKEIGSLTPRSFDLESVPATVTVEPKVPMWALPNSAMKTA
jgi:hypothetical protein